MRKLNYLLTAAFAAALITGFSSRANAAGTVELGKHTFTADVEFTSDYQLLADVFTLPNEFEFTGPATRPSLDDFIRPGSSVYMSYSNGVLSFVSANLGFYATPDYSFNCNVGVATIDGEYSPTNSAVKWTIDDDNHIIIPDFSIVDTNKSNAIIAKYTNCKVDGFPADSGSDQPVEYPAASALKGEYTFKADVVYNEAYSGIESQIPANFTFLIESTYFDNFVGYNGYLNYSYDKETGTITITSNRLQDTSYYLPDTYMGVQLGLSDSTGAWPGLKNSGGDILKLQVSADGSISIPEFTIVDRNNSNPVIARFTNCKVVKAGEEEEEEEDPNQPNLGDFIPVNPELGDYTVVGSYTFTIKPTDFSFGKTQSNVEFQADVIKTSDDLYYIKEGEGTEYLNGSLIPFSYYEGSSLAQFDQFNAGQAGDYSVWFSAFSSTPEIYSWGATFTPEDGFTFDGSHGFGWFCSAEEDGLSPTEHVVSLFYLMGCEKQAEPVEYPASGQFDGHYKYSCADFTLLDETYANILKADVNFEVITTFNQATGVGTSNILNFFVVSNGTDYNKETGVLTLNTVYFKPDGAPENLGIAPVDGGWTGMAGLYANKMKWQIEEDGTITIPDFDIVTFSGNTLKETIAQYRSGSVVATTGQGEDEGDTKSFAGTYSMKGTKYEYLDGTDAEPATSALNFDLVINEDNQVIAIGGYTLSDEDIANKRNVGVVEGNQLILEAAPFVGVKWQQVVTDTENSTSYTEAWLLGGPNIKTWDQLDETNKIVFTLDEDGNYSLEPFTVWHRHQIVNEAENTETVFDLVYKWDDTVFSEFGNPEIEGEWNIPLNGHYQGSYSLKEFTGTYNVTLNGSTVKFESVNSDYHIIGKFIDESTIEFSREVVVPAIYSLCHVPYINSTNTDEIEALTEETFTAVYNAEEGTLTFPEGSGLAYGRFTSNGELSFWDDAYDFAGVGTKTGDIKPELTISNTKFEIGIGSVAVSVDIEASGFDLASAASWKAQITETFNDIEGERDWTETSFVDATVENGVASFEITDLANGNHDFTFALVAYDENESQMIASNQKALSVVIGPSIMIRNINAEAGVGSITVTFQAIFSGFDTTEASYKVQFTDNTTVTDDYAGDTLLADATVDEEGIVTSTLDGLGVGTFDHNVVLIAYDKDGNKLTTSNNLGYVILVATTGITEFETEGSDVRYFNLQGVEIAKPQPGSVVIKVEGNKVTKVITK